MRASSIRLQGPFKPDVELEVVRKTVPDSSLEEESDDELDTKEQSRSLGVEELSPASPVSSINSDSSENQDDEINLIPARQEVRRCFLRPWPALLSDYSHVCAETRWNWKQAVRYEGEMKCIDESDLSIGGQTTLEKLGKGRLAQ